MSKLFMEETCRHCGMPKNTHKAMCKECFNGGHQDKAILVCEICEGKKRARLEEFAIIKVEKRHIPKGARLIEAYETDTEIIILGDPPEEEGEDPELLHDCDLMGCSSCSHVIYRFRKEND